MIGGIEQAIIDRLRSALPLLGYPLKTVASYENQFDGKDDLARAIGGLPGAWVVFTGSQRPQPKGQTSWELEARFAVLVGAMNKRTHGAARRGDGHTVGAYQIAEDIERLLIGQSLGLEIRALTPLGIKPLAATKAAAGPVSILSVELQTAFALTALPDGLTAPLPGGPTLPEVMAQAAGLGDFASFSATWDPPVTDLIELETA